MILNCDGKALEWHVVTFHSQDKVALQEIYDGADQHTDNQQKFNLPERIIAKKFVFQLIFGGSAYGYANNNDFSHIGDERFWQDVIDRFYEKYRGISAWHKKIVQEAIMTGKLTTQTGRTYRFKPDQYGKWPITCIKNYPVQGLAADIMALARISVFNRLKKFNYGERALLINSVHDSIMLDVDNDSELIYNISMMLEQAFLDVPVNFEKIFGTHFNVPMKAEVEFGFNWKKMLKFDRSNKQAIKDLLNKENK